LTIKTIKFQLLDQLFSFLNKIQSDSGGHGKTNRKSFTKKQRLMRHLSQGPFQSPIHISKQGPFRDILGAF
jgi:hypothetical protein